jgi:hypothetical protein
MAYTKYSLTPADNNAAPPNGAPEGMLPSAVNDTMRDMMAQIRDVGDGIRGGTYTMTAPVITGGSVTGVTSVSTSGNLTFTGTSNRILGDFSNATIASRAAFQSSTTNGNTGVFFIPNGTAVNANIQVVNNSSPTNASITQVVVNATESSLRASITGTGTYLPLTMYTNASERLRIDTSGNVGIGTSSPGAILHTVNTSAGATTVGAFIQNSSNTVGTEVRLGFAANNAALSSDRYGWIGHVNTGGTNGGALTFATTPGGTAATERMRIDSSGNLLVGTTSSLPLISAKINFVATGNQRGSVTGNGNVGEYMTNTSGTGNWTPFSFNNNGTSFSQIGSISTTASATAYNTSSDYRLKEDVAPMTGALSVVAQLKPVTYKWKLDGSASQGFIAHELQEVVPECVTGEKDAVDAEGKPQYQGVDTSFLVATLTAAIQEQQVLITSLTARIAQLESK